MANHSRSLQNDTIIDGTYKVLDFLGEGGMGIVYKVEHLQMNRVFALKILKTSQLSESAWQRFRNEAQAIARLDHRNVVKIYDMNQTENGRPYYTMDFLVGVSLSDYLKQNKVLSLPQALHVFRQVCSGLAYAHTRGIVHRDIKPGNVMLLTDSKTQQFQVKIVDFGIAKLADDEGHTIQGLTKPGEVFGSPLYMSPEQCEGRRLDARSDMYSMAVSMYKALTGRTPFRGRTAIETTMMHQSSVPPLLNSVSPDLQFPPKLEKLIDKMLAKAPDNRYQSLAEVENELQNLQGRIKKAPQTVAPSDNVLEQKDEDQEEQDDQEDHDDDFTDTQVDETETVTTSGELTVKQRSFNKKLTVIAALAFVTIGASIAMLLFLTKTLAEKKVKPNQKLQEAQKAKVIDSGLGDAKDLSEYEGEVTELRKESISTPIDEQIERTITGADQFVKTNSKPYSHKKTLANGQVQTVFQFPSDFSIGSLIFSPAERGKEVANAQGLQLVPLRAEVRFEADEIVGAQPKLLSYFQPDNLVQLKIPKSVESSPELFVNIGRLSSVTHLELADKDLQKSDLESLEKLPHLISLNIGRCRIDGNILAHSPLVRRVFDLNLHGLANVSPVIDALGKNIQFLVLNKCKLSADDLRKVARLPNLTRLYLTGCDIKDDDLAVLAKMKKLEILDIGSCDNLTEGCLATVKTLPKLQRLNLPIQFKNDEVQADLKKQYPNLAF